MKLSKSQKLYDEGRKYIPGGSSSFARVGPWFDPFNLCMACMHEKFGMIFEGKLKFQFSLQYIERGENDFFKKKQICERAR